MQRSSRFVWLEVSNEASGISGVQGLDPKKNEGIMKECISGVLGNQWI